MEKFRPESPNQEIKKGLEDRAFVDDEGTPEGFFNKEEFGRRKNIDPDFGIEKGKSEDNKEHLKRSIKKYLGRKKDDENKSSIRKILGI